MKKAFAILLVLSMLLGASSALALSESGAYDYAKEIVKECLPRCSGFRFLSDELIVLPDSTYLWAVYGDVTYYYGGDRYQEPYVVYFADYGRGNQETLMVVLSEEIVYGDALACYDAGWRNREILDTIEYYYYAQPGGDHYVWIPSGSGSVYHSNSSCSGMRSPVYVEVTDELLWNYRPCSRCWSY